MTLRKKLVLIGCGLLTVFVGLPCLVVVICFGMNFRSREYPLQPTEELIQQTLQLNIPRSDYPYVRVYGYANPLHCYAFVRYAPPHTFPLEVLSRFKDAETEGKEVVMQYLSQAQDDTLTRPAEESGWNRMLKPRSNRFFRLDVRKYYGEGEPSWYTLWQGVAVLDTDANVLLYRMECF